MRTLRHLVTTVSLVASSAALLWAACGDGPPRANVCYEDDLVPLLRRDCAPCHENGEYAVTLAGTAGDRDELARYVTPFDAETSALLDWIAGRAATDRASHRHPRVWAAGSSEYRAVEAWIDEGATEACFDRDRFGECRFDEDCPEIICACPEGVVGPRRDCAVDPDTILGTCARAESCTELRFELCEAPTDGDADADADGDDDDDTGDADGGPVSFADDIVPQLRFDCRMCHYGGRFGVRINGDVSDYPYVMEYVDVADPEGEYGFLWWAAGGAGHPISWPRGSPDYEMFLQWVNEGALDN